MFPNENDAIYACTLRIKALFEQTEAIDRKYPDGNYSCRDREEMHRLLREVDSWEENIEKLKGQTMLKNYENKELLEHLQRFTLQPGDRLVVTVPRRIPMAEVEKIKQAVHNWAPNAPVLVVFDDMHMRVVNESAEVK